MPFSAGASSDLPPPAAGVAFRLRPASLRGSTLSAGGDGSSSRGYGRVSHADYPGINRDSPACGFRFWRQVGSHLFRLAVQIVSIFLSPRYPASRSAAARVALDVPLRVGTGG